MSEFSGLAERFLYLMEQMPRNAPPAVLNELSRGEFFILGYLLEHQRVGRPGELSTAMQTSTARTAAALRNMEKKGWILRCQDDHDHRQTLVHLTPDGETYVRQLRERVLDNIRQILEELGEGDAAEYLRITERMIEIAAGHRIEKSQGGE